MQECVARFSEALEQGNGVQALHILGHWDLLSDCARCERVSGAKVGAGWQVGQGKMEKGDGVDAEEMCRCPAPPAFQVSIFSPFTGPT